ncbi:MAG: hypothetical protein K2X86_17295 [Cytophagaceae bacterium]|nr:hypothetical protein [Cytophagaceae bacterium]
MIFIVKSRISRNAYCLFRISFYYIPLLFLTFLLSFSAFSNSYNIDPLMDGLNPEQQEILKEELHIYEKQLQGLTQEDRKTKIGQFPAKIAQGLFVQEQQSLGKR